MIAVLCIVGFVAFLVGLFWLDQRISRDEPDVTAPSPSEAAPVATLQEAWDAIVQSWERP